MLGAIIGDVVGSPYEYESYKTKSFELFSDECLPTDDSLMTIAVGCACTEADISNEREFKDALIRKMVEIGKSYPYAGYGGAFFSWLFSEKHEPYNSYGNGSAMRVSPVAWVADSLEQAERLARWSAEITHDHEEGIKGAQAVAAAIFLAREGADKETIREYIERNYYALSFTLDEIRPFYDFDVTCQGSVPEAIECFLESVDFEDAIRNAVSLGGDADTQACIAGSIAEAYYGIPEDIKQQARLYIPEPLFEIVSDFYDKYKCGSV